MYLYVYTHNMYVMYVEYTYCTDGMAKYGMT